MKHFLNKLWNEQSNVALRNCLELLQQISGDEGGIIGFKQLCAIHQKFPMVFYPLYMLQVNIINNTLGESWWNEHKAFIKDIKNKKDEATLKALMQHDKEIEDENEIVSEEMLLRRMGFVKYHVLPWLREVEKKRILRIIALENSLN